MEELRLSGALDARPGRYKDRIEAGKAAQSTKANPVAQYAKASIGRPPAHLTTDEKKVWNEIVKQSPALTQSDRLLLEVATKLLCKMRTDGLKSAENTKLINLLEGFKGTVASPQPIPVTNAEPAEDTRAEAEKSWDEFVAEDEEYHRRQKLIAAECQRREQTEPPDCLTEIEKKYWARAYEVEADLFPDVREQRRKMHEQNNAFIDKMRSEGRWTDTKPKVEEKVEYTPIDRPPPEPFIEDPAKKQERMLRRWSM